MNAVLRAVVRCAAQFGMEVFGIWDGYHGMIEGGTFIRRLEWHSVGNILSKVCAACSASGSALASAPTCLRCSRPARACARADRNRHDAQGGTFIGTARCKEFCTREGRVMAARNLMLNGINNLVRSRAGQCGRAARAQ